VPLLGQKNEEFAKQENSAMVAGNALTKGVRGKIHTHDKTRYAKHVHSSGKRTL